MRCRVACPGAAVAVLWAGPVSAAEPFNARCSTEGETGPTPSILQMRGGKLVVWWDGSKPNEMHRYP